MSATRKRYTIRIILIIFLSSFVITIFEPSHFPWSGKIIDKETGKPLAGAVIVRSWDREYATPAGTVSSLSVFAETLSDKKGKFNIFSLVRMFKISIPLFAQIIENKPIVFKPGYRFLSVSEKSSTIELERVPATYYVRYEEIEKVRNSYDTLGYYQTNLLKKVVEGEKEFIRSLNKYVPGVLFTGLTIPIDIEIDQKDNVFITDNGVVKMYPQKGRPNLICGGGSSLSGRKDIEVDRNENLYFFGEGYLHKINNYFQKVNLRNMGVVHGKIMVYRNGLVEPPEFEQGFYRFNRTLFNGLPPRVGRFTLGQNKKVYIIAPHTLFSYDLEGNLLCKKKISNKNSTPSEGDVQLIDIDSAPDGSIIVALSHFNPYWDKTRQSNRHRNGVLIFDQNCNETFYKEIDIDSKVISIVATKSGVIIADRNSIYIYDKNINLISKEEMKGKELGEVWVRRISSDKSGTYLYVIESRYKRILKYNLKTREFCIR